MANFIDIHKGKRCFVVGNGPSLNKTDMSKLKGEITIGSNRCYIGFDKWGIRLKYWGIEDQLVAPDISKEWNKIYFDGKFIPKDLMYFVTNKVNVYPINFNRKDFPALPKFSFSPSVIYWGSSVTYMLLQIAVIMGCNPIYLIGMDHYYTIPKDVERQEGDQNKLTSRSRDPNHFDPNYFGKGRKWHVPRLDKSTRAFRAARIEAERRGIEIYNASITTKLDVFEKVKYNALFDSD